LAESCLLTGVNDIAHHRELVAAAQLWKQRSKLHRSIRRSSVASRGVTHSVAIYSSDYGLCTIRERGPVTYKVCPQVRRVRVVLHFLDVGTYESNAFTHVYAIAASLNDLTSSEHFFTPSNDDGTDGRIGIELCQSIIHLDDQLIAQRVQSSRSVQGDETHVLLFTGGLDFNELVTTSLFCEWKQRMQVLKSIVLDK